MEPPVLSSSNQPETLSEHPTPLNAPLVVVHWSKFGTHRLYVDTADGQHVGWVDLKTGRRSIAFPEFAPAFEIAVTEAETARAAELAQDERRQQLEVCVSDDQADEPPTLMRHAYRGKAAYSSWELGPSGNRLMAEEPRQLVLVDPRSAYLNAVGAR